MRHRLVAWIALVGLAVLPGVARSEGADKPTVVLRLASIDSLTADVLYLAELVGQGEKVKEGVKAIEPHRTGDSLKGVDTKKPLGIYGTVGPKGVQDDSVLVLLLPVTDEDALVTFVGELRGGKPTKDADGTYSVPLGAFPAFSTVYARFTGGYCCISNVKEALDKDRLLPPAEVLPAGKVGLISATVQIDKIPKAMKDAVLSQLDVHLANARDKGRPEDLENRKLVLDELSAQVRSLLRDGTAIDLKVDVDRTTGELGLSLSLAGKSGSELAANISDLGTSKSIAATLIGRDSASAVQLHLALPSKFKSKLSGALDDLEKKLLDKAPDDTAREIGEIFAKAFLPTLKAAVLDAGLDLRGPGAGGKYTLVLGSRVVDGENIDKAIHKAIEKVPGGLAGIVQLDADKAGSVAIHKINVPLMPREVSDVFGNSPVYIAVRGDALLMTFGDKGLEAIKELVAASAKPGAIVAATSSIGRLVPLLEKTNKDLGEVARKTLGTGTENDKVRLVVQGGEALQIKITAKAQLIKFAAAMKDKGH
jgi:hypothetical protein